MAAFIVGPKSLVVNLPERPPPFDVHDGIEEYRSMGHVLRDGPKTPQNNKETTVCPNARWLRCVKHIILLFILLLLLLTVFPFPAPPPRMPRMCHLQGKKKEKIERHIGSMEGIDFDQISSSEIFLGVGEGGGVEWRCVAEMIWE